MDEALNKTLDMENSGHNQKLKRNREVFKRLIYVKCILSKRNYHFEGMIREQKSFNKGNCVWNSATFKKMGTGARGKF